jgi:hypothetical protein
LACPESQGSHGEVEPAERRAGRGIERNEKLLTRITPGRCYDGLPVRRHGDRSERECMPRAEPASANSPAGARAAIRIGGGPRALAASALLHGAIAVSLWHFEWAPATLPYVPPRAVPIDLGIATELPRRVAPEPPPSQAEPIETEPPPSEARDAQREEVAPDRAARGEPDLESAATTDPTPDVSSAEATDPLAERALLPLVPEDYDVEAARADAVARVVESLRAQSEYRTFSLDDLPGGGATDPDEGAQAQPDIFAAAAKLRSDGALTKGRNSSRLARRIFELCNQLTGGFSIQGFLNICADPAPRADLFGHLRPRYMESVPLCTADEELDIAIEQTGSGAVGSFKCVLVPSSTRRDFYSRYDPELAGWVPAGESAAPTDTR